jgi:hypothetical protein
MAAAMVRIGASAPDVFYDKLTVRASPGIAARIATP